MTNHLNSSAYGGNRLKGKEEKSNKLSRPKLTPPQQTIRVASSPMTDQRQDKQNGFGKLSIAGKKRRKGQDLQPIQTAPPSTTNGYRTQFTGQQGLSVAQNSAYRGYTIDLGVAVDVVGGLRWIRLRRR